VALQDARQQLFDAAERVLLRDGAGALTSRAVTAEAGCAKGVLHRHFADFDAFLAELVLVHVERAHWRAVELDACAETGTGTVVGNLSSALAGVFSPVVVALITLVIARDELRARLRHGGSRGLPLVRETTAMVAAYLTAEQQYGRVTPDADVRTLAPTLIGAVHLRAADREAEPAQVQDLRPFVQAVLGAVLVHGG
jgi:AcrR family transcriptional regulator